jgi:hypothetical protein
MARHLRGRGFGRRPRRKTGLIICGGTETEPRYLDALKLRLRLGGIDIRGMAKDPDTLIEEAVAMRRRHEKAGNEPYDATWLVFDSERPGTFDIPAVLQRAKSEGIETALSGPSFELWLLLHHEFTTASFDDAKQVEQRLVGRDPGFAKATFAVDHYLDRIGQALAHAKQLKEQRQRLGDVAWQTSGTDVDLLVLWMRSSLT